MPTTQVIDRRNNPQVEQMQNATNALSDTLYKQQSLKMTGQYYKILAKNAETEADKAHYTRLSDLMTNYLPQIQATNDPAQKSMLISALKDSGMYNGDAQQLFHDMSTSQPQVDRNYQALKQRDAQNPMTPNQGAYGDQSGQGGPSQPQQTPFQGASSQGVPPNQAAMAAINPMMAGGGNPMVPQSPAQQQMQPTPAAPGMTPMTGGSQIPNQPQQTGADQQDQDQSQAQGGVGGSGYMTPGQLAASQGAQYQSEASLNALKAQLLQRAMRNMPGGGGGGQQQGSSTDEMSGAPNQMVASGMSVDPMTGLPTVQYTNPAVKAMEARATAIASGQGEKMVNLEGIKSQYSAYKDALDGAIQEQGGQQNTAIGAQLAGMKGSITKHFTPNSNIDKVDNMLMPLSVRITSLANAGRGNLPEVRADMDLLPNRHTQQATNEFRDKMVQSMWNMSPPQMYQSVKQIQSVNQKDAAATKAMQAKGYSPQQINATLEQLHQEEEGQ